MVLVNTQGDREKVLVERFAKLNEEKADLEAKLSEVKSEYNDVENEIIELLNDQGKTSSAKYEGIGHVTSVKPRLFARVIKGREGELFNFLEKEGRGDMVKEYVHPSALSTFVKSQLEDGKDVPPGADYYLKSSLRLFKS